MDAFRLGRKREALALAEAAHQMVIEIPNGPAQDGEASAWYGYLLALTAGQLKEGLDVCRRTAARCFWEPRVHEYLARLELAAGLRRNAIAACERGLALSPDDVELTTLRETMGVRRSPALRFLNRSHPLNRWFGRLRGQPRRPTAGATPDEETAG
jgi:hypothetical protein